MKRKKTLLLNATYEPILFIDGIEALILVFKEKVEVISNWDEFVKTVSTDFRIPATIRLKERVKRPTRPPKFNRRGLFNRDGWKCSYCGKSLTLSEATIDHINPRSAGGKKSWLNCVTSCKICNRRKSNHFLNEIGLELRAIPHIPKHYDFLDRLTDDIHPDWEIYGNL